jgi:UDP-GlcNAc:undecaprenyl-phosphate/decaprenyl-phosphate GlcNAc-1-phosphate transferase
MLSATNYILPFLVALLVSYLLIPVVKNLAIRMKIVDLPQKRKVHKKPIPRLGGVGIYLAFLLVSLAFLYFNKHYFTFGPISDLDPRGPFIGMLVGGFVLVIGGVLDDVFDLSPFRKFAFQALAALVAIGFGVGIDFIRSPFGGVIRLDELVFQVDFFSYQLEFVLWADLLAFFWLVAVINVVNWLDGLDGLAAGVSAIAALFIFIISILAGVEQPLTALVAIILAGSILGFLPYNFNPASIFMGDSGSQFLGYMLGILAIICGGKLATAGLVLGFPILDGLWVVSRRLSEGHSPFKADKKHLHHRLLAIGLTQKQVVILLYLLSIVFGLIAVFAGSYDKFWAGVILVFLMVLAGFFLVVKERQKLEENS